MNEEVRETGRHGDSPFAELSPPYSTIVVDPPWQYGSKAPTWGAGTRGRAAAGSRRGVGVDRHYSTLSNSDIAALPVGALAAPDCALYLWVTNPLMFGDGTDVAPIDMLKGWGFRYVTALTWIKTGPPGMGYSFRGHTEHVLYAVRGTVAIPVERRESNVITAPRRGHSVKPAAFFDLVERVSAGPYLELFARAPRLGWDSWGDGYESRVTA